MEKEFELKILDILVYYDFPFVFTAIDENGYKYICSLLDDVKSQENNYYHGVRIDDETYNILDKKSIDLDELSFALSLFESHPIYLVTVSEKITAKLIDKN